MRGKQSGCCSTSPPSTFNRPLHSPQIAGSNLVPVKQESTLSSADVNPTSSAPIRPAHSISDYNRRDFTRSAVPGSVYSLYVKYWPFSPFISLSPNLFVLFIFHLYFPSVTFRNWGRCCIPVWDQLCSCHSCTSRALSYAFSLLRYNKSVI